MLSPQSEPLWGCGLTILHVSLTAAAAPSAARNPARCPPPERHVARDAPSDAALRPPPRRASGGCALIVNGAELAP
eukprot:CAMPEP_0185488676 /NCGR_PEP_ID=MMETSP1366-20130426/12584_1 /TAXON_ID=38817 /ORGANISM="Gephyrocapsa oceanica, Strain RCC1303" /LENGTH=75 /DNA_ID=CAMNT_0028097183 /DNA_START=78 /DNA_END=303 /DNA_ORIENTATION=+